MNQVNTPDEERAIFEAVFSNDGTDRRPSSLAWLPWVGALAVHGLILVLANRAEPSLETWSARMAAAIHDDLSSQAPIAIEDAPPVPTPPDRAHDERPSEAESSQPSANDHEVARPRRARVSEARSAPPTEAGRIVESEADLQGPVDLTEQAFVTGTATAYAGGSTPREGTGRIAAPVAAGTGTPTGSPSRAEPVRLRADSWRCAWPVAALSEDIYEQHVVLRVVVRADGSVERASAVDDPGHGFAEAAIRCARRTRFVPALNRDGRPTRATSPPIRVRFTR